VHEVVILNENNLIPGAHKLTVEEASRGGKASAAARSLRSAVKKRLRDNPNLFDEIIDMLVDKILNEGDLRALDLFLELAGESPRQMEIAIKKQELKLKKRNQENQNW
jgi:hypothetical protein